MNVSNYLATTATSGISDGNLAYNLGDQGRHKEAEPLYRKAVAVR